MDGHNYGYNLPISEKTKMVPWEEKVRIVEEIKSDFRFKEYIFGCLNCGVCTASCPSNRFFDLLPTGDRPEVLRGRCGGPLRYDARIHLGLLSMLYLLDQVPLCE